MVVQWKLPGSLSTWVQRAGRAARDPGRTGLAVLLVERSAYNVDLDDSETVIPTKGPQQRKKTKKGEKAEKKSKAKQKSKKEVQAYAIAHGVRRGEQDGRFDEVAVKCCPPFKPDAADEGMHVFVQTTLCRREVLTATYNNEEPGEFTRL